MMMWHCLDCASDSSCQLFSVQLAYSADAIWFEAICAFWEREKERARAVIHSRCFWNSHRKFSNYFISYLMKKYELYLTFSIIIISPTPDRDWDGAAACRAKPLSARGRRHLFSRLLTSAWDRFFWDRPF